MADTTIKEYNFLDPQGLEETLNLLMVLINQNIKDYVADQAYDDSELSQAVQENTDAITVLNGTGQGSVAKQVADALAALVNGAPESLDTLKEISDWISNHADSASAMNSQIQDNQTAITELAALVGQLPEGTEATTIVEYIDSALGDYATNLTETLNQIKNDITGLDGRVTELESNKYTPMTSDQINTIFTNNADAWTIPSTTNGTAGEAGGGAVDE